MADSRYTFDISKIKKGYWPKKERRTNMLTTKQARENQEKYGFNELVEGKKKSTMQIFLEQFKDFLVIILIISAVISGILGDAESAIVIFVVITMNAILGTVQTVKAEQSLNFKTVICSGSESSKRWKYYSDSVERGDDWR